MKRAALVTSSGYADLTPDDRLLLGPLRSQGFEVTAAVWDDPSVDWTSFDIAVIRSTWDYHKRYAEYLAWLDHLERVRAAVWNPVPLLRENTNKRYLAALQHRGFPVAPTEIVSAGGSFREVMAARGWTRAVIKPVVSATAWKTRVIGIEDELLPAEDEYLVQPFLQEIVTRGEWSFVCLDGALSHAVLKRAAPGDFRVQEEFGGHAVPAQPPPSLLDDVQAILDTIDQPWLYARVDGVEIGGRLLLMELELTEPALFLQLEPRAPERLARAMVHHTRRAA